MPEECAYSGLMSRSLPEATEQAEALADWFEEQGPSPDSKRPVEEYYLEYLAETRNLVGAEIGGVVVAARNAGASWHQIGDVLGLSGVEARLEFDPVATRPAPQRHKVDSPGLEF